MSAPGPRALAGRLPKSGRGSEVLANRQARGGRRQKEGPSVKDGAEHDQPRLNLGILPTLIARQLRMAELRAFKDFAIEFGDSRLSPGSFEILELLSHNPGVGQTRLASAIGLEKSSLVPAIGKLEDLGLVERRASTVDKRANELRITSAGEKSLAGFRHYVVARDLRITGEMSEDEIRTLNALLKKVAKSNC